MIPTIGRIVHFYPKGYAPGLDDTLPVHAAIVTRTYDSAFATVDLTVFPPADVPETWEMVSQGTGPEQWSWPPYDPKTVQRDVPNSATSSKQ